MKLRLLVITATAISSLALSGNTSALTMDQFVEICDSSDEQCSDHPLLQAYVGGALDLIAVLDEETDYLSTVYCEKPEKLFNVPEIINYMHAHEELYSDKNAMLLVVRYLEENNGC